MTLSRAVNALLLALCIVVGTANGAAARVPLETFAANPAMDPPRMSPNGKHIAVATRKGKAETVLIYDVDAPSTTLIPIDIPKDVEVDWVDWANDDRILIGASKPSTERWYGTTYNTSLSRVIAVDRDGGNLKILLTNARKLRRNLNLSGILDDLPGDPKSVLMAANDGDGRLSVYRVNVDNGKSEIVRRGNVNTVGWMTDTQGEPRVRVDYRRGRDRIEIRASKSGSEDFDLIYEYGEREIPQFQIVGFTDEKDTAIAVARRNTDRAGLYEYNLATRALGKTLFEHPVVDIGEPVGGPIYDPNTSRLAGIFYAEDTLHRHYFDPALAAVQSKLEATFDDAASVGAVGWSQDRTRFVVSTRGPKDPGSFYLYDPVKNHASLIGRAAPDIAPAELGDVLIIKYKARDGTKIPGYLTLPPGKGDKKLPLIVMPHGGPEARDIVTYDAWSQVLANRGYAVFQPNFRGSAGYGKKYADAGYGQWGKLMQDDVTDGVKALIADGTADAGRVCIVGASYGGYAALAGGAYTPDLYKCVAAIAAVTDLPALVESERLRFGEDSGIYDYVKRTIGDPAKDLERMKAFSPALHAPNFKAPVLLVHGFDDVTVPIDQSNRMDKALRAAGKQVHYVEIKGEGHNFLKPESRLTLFTELEKFLATHLGN
jgi:dipeptidyl aminopeptidase/acylaminoacyl peptidase